MMPLPFFGAKAIMRFGVPAVFFIIIFGQAFYISHLRSVAAEAESARFRQVAKASEDARTIERTERERIKENEKKYLLEKTSTESAIERNRSDNERLRKSNANRHSVPGSGVLGTGGGTSCSAERRLLEQCDGMAGSQLDDASEVAGKVAEGAEQCTDQLRFLKGLLDKGQ